MLLHTSSKSEIKNALFYSSGTHILPDPISLYQCCLLHQAFLSLYMFLLRGLLFSYLMLRLLHRYHMLYWTFYKTYSLLIKNIYIYPLPLMVRKITHRIHNVHKFGENLVLGCMLLYTAEEIVYRQNLSYYSTSQLEYCI